MSYGLVHTIVLSSEHAQAPQVEFFVKDMEAVKRSDTPWVIVHLHRQAVLRILHDSMLTCECRPPFTSCPRDKLDVELALTWHRLFVLCVMTMMMMMVMMMMMMMMMMM